MRLMIFDFWQYNFPSNFYFFNCILKNINLYINPCSWYLCINLWHLQHVVSFCVSLTKRRVVDITNADFSIQRVDKTLFFNVLSGAEVSEESRRLKTQLMKQREEETQRKIKLIQEIKTIQSLRALPFKDFDPTESSGLGLLCEMSLAEVCSISVKQLTVNLSL